MHLYLLIFKTAAFKFNILCEGICSYNSAWSKIVASQHKDNYLCRVDVTRMQCSKHEIHT